MPTSTISADSAVKCSKIIPDHIGRKSWGFGIIRQLEATAIGEVDSAMYYINQAKQIIEKSAPSHQTEAI